MKVFEAGSITKVFTSTLLASLVNEGKIGLTDSINPYYPFPFKEHRKITFLTLANHTSGLPCLPDNLDLSDASNPYQNYTAKELEAYLKMLMTLENEPSESYSYSNLGAGLLGYTLGLTQGTSLRELLQERVFDRYGMTASFTRSVDAGERLVVGLGADGNPTPNWDFDVLAGGGCLLSTTEDLARFAKAQFNPEERELALTRVPTFEVNDKMKIGSLAHPGIRNWGGVLLAQWGDRRLLLLHGCQCNGQGCRSHPLQCLGLSSRLGEYRPVMP